MDDATFTPIGTSIAAVLAGLAADPTAAVTPEQAAAQQAAAREAAEREAALALGEAIAAFEPSEALSAPEAQYSDVPLQDA